MKILLAHANYPEVATTLLPAESPTTPLLISKADSALLKNGKPFFIPDSLGEISAEAELVVRICRLGKTVSERFAHRYYDAVTIGVSFSAQELAQKLQNQHLPADLAYSFDGAAVIGEWVEKEKFRDVQCLPFNLDINGQTVQEGLTAEMRTRIDALVSYVSQYYTLKTGDILYTGCPCMPMPVHINDHLQGSVDGRQVLDFMCK